MVGRVAQMRAVFERPSHKGKRLPSSQIGATSPEKQEEGRPMLLTDLADVSHGHAALQGSTPQRGRRNRSRRGSAVSMESHGSEVSGVSDASESSHWSALTFGATFGGGS